MYIGICISFPNLSAIVLFESAPISDLASVTGDVHRCHDETNGQESTSWETRLVGEFQGTGTGKEYVYWPSKHSKALNGPPMQ